MLPKVKPAMAIWKAREMRTRISSKAQDLLLIERE